MRYFFKVLLLLMLAACGSTDYSDVEYVDRAKVKLDEQAYTATIIELKNALRKNPSNLEARWLLGSTYADLGNGPAAEKELLKARELGVDDNSVLPKLMKAMLNQGKYTKVIELDISSLTVVEKIAEAKTSKGLAYIYEKDYENAERELDAVLRQSAKFAYALVAKAQLFILQKKFKNAEEILNEVLEEHGAYALAWSISGDLAQAENNLEGAVEKYAKAIEYGLDTRLDLLKKSYAFVQLKRYELAQADLDKVKRQGVKNAQVNYAQGLIYFHQKKIVEARTEFEKTLKKDRGHIWAVYFLGATYLMLGNHENARIQFERFVSAVPRYVPARKLLASILFKNSEYKKIEKLMGPVVRTYPKDVVALNLLAKALAKQGETSKAIQLYEKVVEISPESTNARMQLGRGLLESGDQVRGFEVLESVLELDPDFEQAQSLLIVSHIKNNNLKKAEELANSFVRDKPDSLIAKNLLGRILIEENRDTEAEKVFLEVHKLAAGDPGVNSFLAKIALKNNQTEKGKKYYLEILEHHENHLPTLINLAVLEAQGGNKEASTKLLQSAIDAHPDSIQPRILLAREYLKQGKPEQGLILLQQLTVNNRNRNNPFVLGTIGELQLAANEFADARDSFERLVKLQPKEQSGHYNLAMAMNGLKDRVGTKKELEATLALAPEFLLARILLTRLQIADGEMEVAKSNIERMKKTSGDSPDVLALEAAFFARSGDLKKSLVLFQKVNEKSQTTISVLSLSRTQWAIGEQDDAIASLVEWLDKNTTDVKVRLELSSYYLVLNKTSDAIGQYKEVLKTSQENLLALNNLAWNTRKSDPRGALSYAEKASLIAPDSAGVLDTLAMVWLENNDLTKAQNIIERALRKKPDDPTLLYHRAIIFEKSGKKQEALSSLEASLSHDIPFSERDEARRLLKRLK